MKVVATNGSVIPLTTDQKVRGSNPFGFTGRIKSCINFATLFFMSKSRIVSAVKYPAPYLPRNRNMKAISKYLSVRPHGGKVQGVFFFIFQPDDFGCVGGLPYNQAVLAINI
jgi:hypothetical protein